MQRFFTCLIFSVIALAASAQTIADFENFNLSPGEFLNNAADDIFVSGNAELPNDYDEENMFWQGWSISADTDTQTPGFLNQYSAITGGGAEGSTTYAVSFAFFPQIIRLVGDAAGAPVEGVYLTNATYAYLGMRDGVGPAKAFGGPTGNDPDFLLLTIKGYRDGELTPDSVDFYLGDYRFEDNTQDYLVDEWTWVELGSLGNVDSLQFSITGSDVGEFGLNTPAYLCLDNITTSDMPVSSTSPIEDIQWRVWPNPATDYIMVDWPLTADAQAVLYNAQGQVVKSWQLQSGNQSLSVRDLAPGSYWLRCQVGDQMMVRQWYKQ